VGQQGSGRTSPEYAGDREEKRVKQEKPAIPDTTSAIRAAGQEKPKGTKGIKGMAKT
jgi:hypothetical protein